MQSHLPFSIWPLKKTRRISGIPVFLILTSIFCFASCPAMAQQAHDIKRQVILSAIESEQTHELAKDVLRMAYERIKINVEFNDLPAQRALEWANDGKTDGDLARIDGTEKKYPNLIKISIPVTVFEGVAFTRKVDKDISSWSDLKGFATGIIGGIRYSEIGTENLDRLLAKNMTHLFTLLEKDRIDVAVAVLNAGKIEIHRNFRASGIHVIGRPLFTAPLFHFVHKKNLALIPRLESVLLEMEKNGEISSIREASLQRMLSQ